MTEFEREAALGEAAYGAMYEAWPPAVAKACYEDACAHFRRAIAAARRHGATDQAIQLEQRLAAIQAVYNSQFRGL